MDTIQQFHQKKSAVEYLEPERISARQYPYATLSILNNSRQDSPFQRVDEIHHGVVTIKQKLLLEWAKGVLKVYQS